MGLSSRLVGAGDYQVVSRLKLRLKDHFPFVGVALGRGTRWFVQQPAEIKVLFLHLQPEKCELKNVKQAHVSQLTNESPNLPHVQSYGLVPLMLWVLPILNWHLWAFLRIPPFSMLKQGQHNLSTVTHFQPELRVAAIGAAVPAAARRVSFCPPANQLVSVCQQVSCWNSQQKSSQTQELRPALNTLTK